VKIVCAPGSYDFAKEKADLSVVLFGTTKDPDKGAIGNGVPLLLRSARLAPASLAWDLVSLALSVFAADLAGHRTKSPDGWTRTFDLHVAVSNPELWSCCKETVEQLLRFLTTDLWTVSFIEDGLTPQPHPKAKPLEVDAAVLLSGGLDSLIGAIDRSSNGKKLIAVSHTVRGDGAKQKTFANAVSGIQTHLQLPHAKKIPNAETPASQRSRSLMFLAYGVLAATATAGYHDGRTVDLYVCENGFIALNPPLTPARVGSLSTRTTHPIIFAHFHSILAALGLRVNISNPYESMTKGEMLRDCKDQLLLAKLATLSTSCGRFKTFKYQHCGRCVPCLVRRAAFEKWQGKDTTIYWFDELGRDEPEYAGFDDVRSLMIAIAESQAIGVRRWLGATLSSPLVTNREPLREVAGRGLQELEALMVKLTVK
jgi:Queuosine biosynthesis protein QueC